MSYAGGKAILLGEHSVVYGHPALAMSLDRGVHAAAKSAPTSLLSVAPWNAEIVPDDRDTALPLQRAFAKVLATYAEVPRVHVEAQVQIPAGSGLGCSAALGVAVLKAIDEFVGLNAASTATVIERSLVWERVFHGNPSGIDSTLAVSPGLCMFRRGEALTPVRARKPLRLVVGDSGEPSATRGMVEEVARQHARNPARIEKLFEGIAALVTNAKMSIEQGDLKDLGKLMDLNHALLNALMLSTARLEEMCAAARHAGALGAKLTGAGGGGCMIALVEDDEIASRVESELRALSCTSFRVQSHLS